MKIINEGKWNEPWSGTERVCANKACEATLQVESEDIKPTHNQPHVFQFTCPFCDSTNFIPEELLPGKLRKELEAKRTYYSSSSWYD